MKWARSGPNAAKDKEICLSRQIDQSVGGSSPLGLGSYAKVVAGRSHEEAWTVVEDNVLGVRVAPWVVEEGKKAL